MSDYSEDDLLPLSGIQHFAFCERQWGLIYVESQWVENLRTAEGRLLHQRADDPYFMESRGDVKTVRSVPLLSKTLGLYGVADVIEIHQCSPHGERGLKNRTDDASGMRYNIVEYKRGKPKPDDRDEVQLCAQAICLEEMLGITLDYGYMYYGEIKHRHQVDFDDTLRERVKVLAEKMHLLYTHGITPPAVKGKWCKNCSMEDICLPKLGRSGKKAAMYMAGLLEEMNRE
ncbi:MAG: CRISPR-associated protein Cas4 [Dethiobacter sp.]|nr:CRISPR-associated protein Cas4 [Dethiobacter sp.]